MKKILQILTRLLFPPRCALCHRPLPRLQSDVCHNCRVQTDPCPPMRKKIPHVAHWCAMWYYKDNVRESLHRYKFYHAHSYAVIYARLLALKVQQELDPFDILTWVPVSRARMRKRGYDQAKLLAVALGQELGCPAVPLLCKVRNNTAQSSLEDAAQRRANVLGVYQAIPGEDIRGKRILLVDDIVTTGATVGEAARVLLTAGASEVICAAVAAAVEKP